MVFMILFWIMILLNLKIKIFSLNFWDVTAIPVCFTPSTPHSYTPTNIDHVMQSLTTNPSDDTQYLDIEALPLTNPSQGSLQSYSTSLTFTI